MVKLTIDGKNVTVAAGATILEAAATVGIKIPTLCWLQKVSPTGACRVCAVEVEGVDRPMTACNTPVKEGINVTTQSEKLTEIRRKLLELLLVNHPLDCPVCDAGGECDLQDSCFGLGASRQEYSALLEKRPIRYDWKLLESDPNRCILCEKCVKVDHEIVGADAIEVVNRGEATIIDTHDGAPLNCEFCGNCIAACPTGTLISKPFKFRGRPWTFNITKSVCAFCSAGCQIEYHARDGRVERVTSEDDTYNSGNLCINGRFGYSAFNAPERLIIPTVNGAETDWESAVSTAANRLKGIVTAHGPDAAAAIASPRLTNEENFLFQKLMRVAIGTNNIDSEARFGYAPAQALLAKNIGLYGASNPIDRIDTAAAILVFGCDLNAESTAVEYRVIKAATKNDAKLVVANMRDVKLTKYNHGRLKYRPGSEALLVNGLIRAILDAGVEDREFIAKYVSNLDALKESLAGISLSQVAEATGVPEKDIIESARLIAGKSSLAIIFGADAMRSTVSADCIAALGNLALVTGCLGKEAGGLFPIDEKNNAQGMLDMGVAPDSLPGYHAGNAAAVFETAWGAKLPAAPGKDLWQIVEGIEQGSIKALYIAGSDPLAAFPNNRRIRKAFDKLEFLLVQDSFPTESAKMANVVFPASLAPEKSGTFTTLDHRVQCLGKAVNAPGLAREDWDIFAELYGKLAPASVITGPEQILTEIKALSNLYGGECSVVKGRCQGAGKRGFALKEGLSFVPVSAKSADGGDYQLLVGPILYHNGTISGWSANNLTVAPEGYIAIAADDAGRLGIAEGAAIRVTSSAGSMTGPARISKALQKGLLFAPHHFRGLNSNALLEGSANLVTVKVEKG
ncbi:MAG: molybdopterin-dependent oxidoreductase [Geobacter sp.]|nr:molybdopterin-dependent oxidoreductase [Geobacter sp.]